MWKTVIAFLATFFILVSTGNSKEKSHKYGSTSGLGVSSGESTEHSTEKTTEKNLSTKISANSLIENITNKTTEDSTKKTIDTPLKRVTETSTDNISKKPITHITDSTDKVTEKSAHKTTQNPKRISTEKSNNYEHQGNKEDKSDENWSSSGSGESMEYSTEKVTDNRKKNVADKNTEKSTKNTTPKPMMKVTESSTDKPAEKSRHKTTKDPTGWSIEKPHNTEHRNPNNTWNNTKKSCTGCNRCDKNKHDDQDRKKYNWCKSISNINNSSEEDGDDDDKSDGDSGDIQRKCGKDNHNDNNNTTMTTTTPKPTKCYDEAEKFYIPGDIAFSAKQLKELMRLYPNENVMISNPAALVIMGMLSVSANGEAYTQILKALNFNNVELVKCFYKYIIPVVLNIPYVEYRLAAKIYSDNVCPLTRDFRIQTKNIFTFEPTNLDFQDPKSARNISQEVAELTNNRFVDFIQPKLLSRLSGLVLISAEYFQGEWQKQFDPLHTKPRDFYTSSSKTIKVNTMYQKGTFLYTESSQLDSKILKMKYIGDEFSFAIILPNRRDGFKGVLNKLIQPDLIISALDSLKMEMVEIYMPTFNMTVALRLRDPVAAAGVTKIFNNKTAGLEDITPCSGTYVSDILQKATFRMDEFGAGHSKRTDFNLEEISPEEDNRRSQTFRVDHPFLFVLIYRKFFVYVGAWGIN